MLNTLKSIVLIPIGLAMMLALISFIIGWNIASLFLFWFILTPVLAIQISSIISKTRNSITEPLSGLILFYGFMVLMIYKQYQTDYFKLMIISCLINILVISLISFVKRSISAETSAANI